MEAIKLSEYYAIATDRCMRALADCYESCHDNSGDPVTDSDKISMVISKTEEVIHNELTLITEAVKEYHGE